MWSEEAESFIADEQRRPFLAATAFYTEAVYGFRSGA
jgi:hypothetical protein